MQLGYTCFAYSNSWRQFRIFCENRIQLAIKGITVWAYFLSTLSKKWNLRYFPYGAYKQWEVSSLIHTLGVSMIYLWQSLPETKHWFQKWIGMARRMMSSHPKSYLDPIIYIGKSNIYWRRMKKTSDLQCDNCNNDSLKITLILREKLYYRICIDRKNLQAFRWACQTWKDFPDSCWHCSFFDTPIRNSPMAPMNTGVVMSLFLDCT